MPEQQYCQKTISARFARASSGRARGRHWQRESGGASKMGHAKQTAHPEVDVISRKLCFDCKPGTKSTCIPLRADLLRHDTYVYCL